MSRKDNFFVLGVAITLAALGLVLASGWVGWLS